MSFFGRLGHVVTGLGGALEAIPGFAIDVAKGVTDPEAGGLFHTIVQSTENRGAQLMTDAMGPQGAIGSAIGGMPDWMRRPGRYTLTPMFEADRKIYSNYVSHPLATLLTVGSLSESKTWQGTSGDSNWGTLFDPRSWGKAWDMTQHESVGQAFADNLNFAFLQSLGGGPNNEDVLDLAAVKKFHGSDFYHAVSGLTDAVASWEYDPLARLTHYGKGEIMARYVRPLTEGTEAGAAAIQDVIGERGVGDRTPEYRAETQRLANEAAVEAGTAAKTNQVERYLRSNRWAKLDKTIAQIQDQLPDVNDRTGRIMNDLLPSKIPNRGFLAYNLATAENPALREYVMRMAMGDNTAIATIQETNPALAERMRAQFESQVMLHDPAMVSDWHENAAYRPDVNQTAQMDEVLGMSKERLAKTIGSVQTEMRAPGPLADLKLSARNSDFYQTSPWAKPVRVFVNKAADNVIDVMDPNHIQSVDAALREAGFSYEERLNWQGRIAAEPLGTRVNAEGTGIIQQAETAAINRIIEKHGVLPEDLKTLLEGGNQHRDAATKVLAQAEPDSAGNWNAEFDFDGEHTRTVRKAFDPANIYLMTDMRKLDQQFSWLHEHGWDSGTKIPKEILDQSMKMWRAGVLLRPAWPIRVVGEHGLAMMGKMYELSHGMAELQKEIKDYAPWKEGYKRTFNQLAEKNSYFWGGGTGAVLGAAVGGPMGFVVGGAAGAAAQYFLRGIDEIPYHQIAVNGILAHDAFGALGDQQKVYHGLVSSENDLQQGMRRTRPDAKIDIHPSMDAETRSVIEKWNAHVDQHMEDYWRNVQETEFGAVDSVIPKSPRQGINTLFGQDAADHFWETNPPPPMTDEYIPTDRILTPQDDILPRNLKDYIAEHHSTNPPAVQVVKAGDFYYLIDGNHRVNVAHFTGDAEVRAHVVDVTHLTPPALLERWQREAADTINATPKVQPIPKFTDLALGPTERNVTVLPGHPRYPAEYERLVADLQKDPLARVILSHDHGVPTYTAPGLDLTDKTGADVGEYWLKHTPEGKKYASENGIRARDMETWTRSLQDLSHSYTAADPILARKLLAGEKVTHADLEAAVGDRVANPIPEGFATDPKDIPNFLDEHGKYREGYYTHPEDFRPQGFWHVSVDAPSAIREGVLSRAELSDQMRGEQVGLGGDFGSQHGVSVTVDHATAQRINDVMKLGITTAQGGTHLSVAQEFNRISDQALLTNMDAVYPEVKHAAIGDESYRFRKGGKFAKVTTLEDLAKAAQDMGMTPMELFRAIDEGMHGQGGWQAVQMMGDEHSYAHLDPTKVGILRMAVDKTAAGGTGQGADLYEHTYDSDHLRVIGSDKMNGHPLPEQMPTLNPEYHSQVRGTSPRLKGMQAVIEKWRHNLGTIPLDNLINDRYFQMHYYRDVKMALSGLDPANLDNNIMDHIMENSRQSALKGMRDLMYDFTNRSEFAETVRHIMPFFPAWQQTLQRWTGIAAHNPEFIVRAKEILDAPGKMGLTWTDKDTKEEYVRFRVPSFARALIGHGYLAHALDDQGYFKFQTKGLSMAGEGLPGFGPWVDVGLQPFVKSHPDMISSLKMVYPFGAAPDSVIQSFMPPSVQRLTAINDNDAKSFRSGYNRILITKLVKMNTGELPKLNLNDPGVRANFLADVESEAKSLASFRLVAGLFSPAALQYDSPYQPLLDKYQELLKSDPEHAQDKFLDEWGDDFFPLTQAFTKLNNGIPATIQGDAEYRKYQDMVQKYPDLGGLITGTDGAGSAAEFSAAIYQKQRNTLIRPGSNLTMRSPLSGEEIVQNVDAREGWSKFTRTMDMLDAIRNQRGLHSYNDKGASDLAALKDLATARIATQHPQWYSEYATRNDVAWDNKMAGLRDIAADPRLKQRPDIEGLNKYLATRDTIMALLAQRAASGGSADIHSLANNDLWMLRDIAINRIKDGPGGLAFSSLFNRYLINDPFATTGHNTLGAPSGGIPTAAVA